MIVAQSATKAVRAAAGQWPNPDATTAGPRAAAIPRAPGFQRGRSAPRRQPVQHPIQPFADPLRFDEVS